LPDVNKVIRVACSGHISTNNPWVSRFYLSYSGSAPTPGDLTDFCDTVIAAWSAGVNDLCDGATHLSQVDVIDLTTVSSATAEVVSDVAGDRAGGNVPADLCAVVSYTIARRYRGGHPRGYWPFGVTEDFDTTYTWSSDFTAEVDTILGIFFSSLTSGGWGGSGELNHVNVSYYAGFTVVTDPITGRARNVPDVKPTPDVDLVSGIVTRASMGTQRRRLQYQD